MYPLKILKYKQYSIPSPFFQGFLPISNINAEAPFCPIASITSFSEMRAAIFPSSPKTSNTAIYEPEKYFTSLRAGTLELTAKHFSKTGSLSFFLSAETLLTYSLASPVLSSAEKSKNVPMMKSERLNP